MPIVFRPRFLFLVLALSRLVYGTTYNGDPGSYVTLLTKLQAGDTLILAAGTYAPFTVSGLNGTPASWITITGPATGPAAIVAGRACCNNVEIVNSSYVAIQHLTIDGQGIPGVFGLSAKAGLGNLTHDILVEGNTFIGQTGSQQTSGISTKTPTWGWIIRGNTITNAGTGMYLGDSDGSSPFIGGLIEGNFVQGTIGYNLQIKFQKPRPVVAGMPTGQSITIIRNNVFIKNDQASPDGNRPNVLVGGFPASGAGSTDMYEVYGNFFDHNPREALFQASGRVSVHDNIFVDGQYTAATFQDQDLPLNLAYVYNNTIYSSAEGIHFGSTARTDDAVTGNLVFGATPIVGPIAHLSNNTVDSLANAALYVNAPSFTLGAMDFYPLVGKVEGPTLDLSGFVTDVDFGIDFNGTAKTAALQAIVFRGAYAGEGVNPGWKLQAGLKSVGGGAGAPLASLSGTSLTFASQNPGTTSAPQTVTLSNLGSAPLAITGISITGTNPGDFGETNTCGSSLVAGGSCSIPVTFTPAAPGTRSAAVTIIDNAAGSPHTVSLSGIGAGGPVASLSPTSLTFSSQNLGSTSASQTVTLSNPGPVPLSITSISITGTNPGDFGQTNTCGSSLAAGGSCGIPVTFTPAAAGARSAAVTIIDNAAGSPHTVSLSGTGQAAAGSPAFLLHGNTTEINGTTNGSSVQPTNAPAGLPGSVVVQGSGSVSFANPAINGNGAAFGLGGQQNSNTAFLNFTGPSVGSIFNVSQGDLSFYLKSSYTFAQRKTLSSRYVFEVNDGTTRLFSFQVVASGTSMVVYYTTGTGSSSWYYIPAGQEDALFGKGVVAKIRLTWNGTQNILYWNDVAVATRAYTKGTPVWGANSSFVIGATSVFNSTGGYFSCDDSIAEFQMATGGGSGTPTVSLSTTSLTFGSQSQRTTSAPQTITLSNPGSAPLSITSISITGANPGDFGQTNTCGGGLAPGGSCSIPVTFTPAAAGARSATVTIIDNAAGSPHTVSLSGTGAGAPVASLNTTSLTFGNQNMGSTSASQTVILSNPGTAPLSITSISITGANPGDFRETNTCGSSLAAAGSCIIPVTFSPVATGSRSAAVTIIDNAAGSPHTISLSGTGQAAGATGFLLHGNTTEIHGTTNGASLQPTNAPTGLLGSVVVQGSGSVSFANPAINGNGVAFGLGGQQNSNTAFLNFTGPSVGSIFNVNQGDLSFYLKSSYTFAQRKTLSSRYVFEVNDGTTRLFSFQVVASGSNLVVFYTTGTGSSSWYYIPAGQEDALFGKGVVAKIRLTWNGTQNVLYWNDVAVATRAYTKGTAVWGANSSFVIGATSVLNSTGGYFSCDDSIAEFQIH